MASMTSSVTQADENVPDIFRILITNDNHVGFKEDDPVRQNDALASFEEIMQIGRSLNVDFVLHSGDLFDACRPNRHWLTSVMRLLQLHCFGDRDINFQQLRTDDSKPANFEDPNRNIDMPIFMIHGNHDDPGGEYGCPSTIAAADMLDVNYLVNYFGKVDNVDEEIEISPLLFQKGGSKIALYGLGNISDERLHRMFQAKKVKFLAPPNLEEYFHIMAIHQNRYRGGAGGQPAKNCVHLSFLPSFLNLIVWAHEHECIPSPEHSVECGFFVLQSGSSIQTSLSVSEQSPKHVFLLEVHKSDFRVHPIPLLSVRSLLIDETILPSNTALNSAQAESLMVSKVEQLIRRGTEENQLRLSSRQKWLSDRNFSSCMFEPNQPLLPLVRLRVHVPPSPDLQDRVGNVHILNQKFGRQFTGRVANPGEILHIASKKSTRTNRSESNGVVSLAIEDEPMLTGEASQEAAIDVQTIIFNYLGGEQGEALLSALTEPDFNDAVQDYVHRNDLGAIERYLKCQVVEMNKAAIDSGLTDPDGILEILKRRARDKRNSRIVDVGHQDGMNMHDEPNLVLQRSPHMSEESNIPLRRTSISSDEDIFEEAPVVPPIKKSRQESPESVSSDEVFADTTNRKRGGAKRATAKPKTAKTNSQSSVLAAFGISSQAPSVLAPSSQPVTATAKRQWARRL